jgi:hypothetical protein
LIDGISLWGLVPLSGISVVSSLLKIQKWELSISAFFVLCALVIPELSLSEDTPEFSVWRLLTNPQNFFGFEIESGLTMLMM